MDFKGMLPGVGLRDVVYDGGVLIELINQLAVQRDNAQGGAISAQIVDARSGETCLVAGSEYEHPVKAILQKELIRPGSYASRIDIPRVRNDKTGKFSLRIGRAGPVKIPEKLLFQQRRIGRVPGPGNYRLPDFCDAHVCPCLFFHRSFQRPSETTAVNVLGVIRSWASASTL